MIGFDDVNIQWEDAGDKKRLVIVVNNAPTLTDSMRDHVEFQLYGHIKSTLNDLPIQN